MIYKAAFASAAVLTASPLFGATEPAAALATARQQIARHEYEAAVQTLRASEPAAQALPKLSDRVSAVSAIHFYTALALTELGKLDEAAKALRAFFEYRTNVNLDTKRYNPQFATLFNKAQETANRERGPKTGFDSHYPGFELARPEEPPINALWGSSTAFYLLATDDEKRQWSSLTTDDARQQFVDAFWKRRDPDPETPENSVRHTVMSRIAFADHMFAAGEERGSLSDRGQVFALFGKPFRIVVRPLNQLEAVWQPERRGAGSGAVEVWEYRREQLPGKIPSHFTSFKFVSGPHSTTRSLQRDFQTLGAIGAAKEAFSGKRQ